MGARGWVVGIEQAWDRVRLHRTGDRTPDDFRIEAYGGHGGAAEGVVVRGRALDDPVPTDAVVGKRTLAVRLGDRRSRGLYVGLLALSLVLVLAVATTHPWALLALLSAAQLLPAVRLVRGGSTGLALIPVLQHTGRAELLYGLLLGLGLALS